MSIFFFFFFKSVSLDIEKISNNPGGKLGIYDILNFHFSLNRAFGLIGIQ